MKKVLVLGYYGYENCGDDAILLSIIKSININIKDKVEVTVLSNNPKLTSQQYKVKAINRFNPIKVFLNVLNTDCILFGGGTLIQDKTSNRSLWYYLSVVWLGKVFNKKVILYSNGISTLNSNFNKSIAKKVLNRVDVITLREESSCEELNKLQIKKPKVLVTADPVFGLDKCIKEEYKYIYERENIPIDKPILGITIRKWDNLDYYTDKMACFCDEIIKNEGMNVIFLNMQYKPDKMVANIIKNKMKEKCYIVEKDLSVREVIGAISNIDILLGMRLHGLIFAAKQRIPMVGLSYTPKIDYYIKKLNMYRIGDTKEIKVNEAVNLIKYIRKNYSSIQEELNKIVNELENEESKNIDQLEELLN